MSKDNNTSSPTATNWASRTKAAANVVPLTKKSSERGTRHEGTLALFEPVVYSTGSFGIKLAYSIQGLDRKAYENVVLRTMDKDGNYKATQYGESTLKRRLAAFGLTADDINAFVIPKTPKDSHANESFIGAPVAVYLTDEEYLGKPTKRVKAVYPIED